MNYAVGYQLTEEIGAFPEMISRYLHAIEEVYFPWLDMPSGRSPMTDGMDVPISDAKYLLEEDLKALALMGVQLNLLFNANCYGEHSLSQDFQHRICSIIEHIRTHCGLSAITTTSLMVARTVREAFPDIDVRASVNMRLGTIRAMEYVDRLFTSFYVQREYNRDLPTLQRIVSWGAARGKSIHILANSGCLNFCSGQTFHDNLVAHESQLSSLRNINWNPAICWHVYQNPDLWVRVLQNSWIRPEDMHYLEAIGISSAKLATRMHRNPERVIHAYSRQKFGGNLLDLFEPGHGSLFEGYILDNTRFPSDWFAKTSSCSQSCDTCNYCASVLPDVLVKLDRD